MSGTHAPELSPPIHNHTSGHRTRFELWFGLGMTVLVMFMFLGLRSHVDDDLWLHLRIGEELRSGTSFEKLPDPLVLLADRPYIPSQWLSEILGSAIYDWCGLTGIHVIRVTAIFLVVALVYAAARCFLAPRGAITVAFLVSVATSAAWAERPQLVGLLLMALLVFLLSSAWQRKWPLWPVIPIMWLWVCLHGTWIVGLATIGLFTLLMLNDDRSQRANLRGWTIMAGSIAVLGLTPLGLTALTQPFTVSSAAKATVNEWQTPTWDNPTFFLTASLAIVAVAFGILQRQRRAPVLLLCVAALLLATYSVRTVAFAAILLAPALGLTGHSAGRTPTSSGARRQEKLTWAAYAALVVALALMMGPPPQRISEPQLVSALQRLPTGARVAADIGVSGWLLFHEPQLTPLRDLRAESYSEATTVAYFSFWNAQPGWRSYLDANGVDAILTLTTQRLSTEVKSSGWSRLAQGDGYALYGRPQSSSSIR